MDGSKLQIDLDSPTDREIPPVSVAISLYNYKKYVVSCLDSVRSQTIKQLDLIVVDDCSNDGSPEIVKYWMDTYGTRFNNSQLIRHTTNKGLAMARNSGFQNARTKYVFVLDADNVLYPHCIERLAAALENCDASFAYCYQEKFGKVSCLQNTKPWNPATLQFGNTIDAMVLLRKDVWESIGGFLHNEIMGWEDFESWFRIARIKGWGILVPEILARYRVHSSSMLNCITNPNADKLWSYLKLNYPEFFTR